MLSITFLAYASAVKLNSSTVANGKSFYVEIKGEKGKKYTNIEFLNKNYPIYKHPVKKDLFYAVVPVSYYAKAKKNKVFINYVKNSKQKQSQVSLLVKNGDYKKEKLKVQSSQITLSKKNKLRTAKEYKEAMKIYNTCEKQSYISSNFIFPLESKITSEFGKARIFNDKLKSYHGGTDYRAKVGTPIKASNDGVVVLAKNRFYAGGSIIINHGHGIYTCYYHMSKFKVKQGQKVKKGQIIGLSGVSGRVTGPHLHFGIRFAGVQVDPLQFIALMNKYILKGIR